MVTFHFEISISLNPTNLLSGTCFPLAKRTFSRDEKVNNKVVWSCDFYQLTFYFLIQFFSPEIFPFLSWTCDTGLPVELEPEIPSFEPSWIKYKFSDRTSQIFQNQIFFALFNLKWKILHSFNFSRWSDIQVFIYIRIRVEFFFFFFFTRN